MPLELHWQIPTIEPHGDGRRAWGRTSRPTRSTKLVDLRGEHFNYYDHLHQIARAAELAGFDGIHVPNDPAGEEPWIVASVVARATRYVRVLTELHAGLGSAVYAAKQAVSFQRFTQGRLDWHLTDGDPKTRQLLGDTLPDDQLEARLEEFVIVARGVFGPPPFTFRGQHFAVEAGGFDGPLGGLPVPRVFLSGPHVDKVGPGLADVIFLEPAPLEVLRARITGLREAAAGRPISFAVARTVVARATDDEARRDAARATVQASVAATWVGSYDGIAAEIARHAAIGVAHYVLGAAPHLEEAYRVGEHVLPKVRALVGREAKVA
jgi:alkanesulfonate monooxygenase